MSVNLVQSYFLAWQERGTGIRNGEVHIISAQGCREVFTPWCIENGEKLDLANWYKKTQVDGIHDKRTT